jgi:hypothetical protein
MSARTNRARIDNERCRRAPLRPPFDRSSDRTRPKRLSRDDERRVRCVADQRGLLAKRARLSERDPIGIPVVASRKRIADADDIGRVVVA